MTVEFVKNKCVYCFYICVKIYYMYGEYKLFIDRLPLFNKNYIFLKGLFVFHMGTASLRAMNFPVILSVD